MYALNAVLIIAALAGAAGLIVGFIAGAAMVRIGAEAEAELLQDRRRRERREK